MTAKAKAEMLEFLHRKISELPFSYDFKIRAGLMGFYSLREIALTPKKELRSKNGYSKGWQEELEYRLAEVGLLNVLKNPEAFLSA